MNRHLSTDTSAADTSWSHEFGDFWGRVWMNASHQGPLPNVAIQSIEQAAAGKHSPAKIPDAAFSDTPEELRAALADLVGGSCEEIVLGNSTSHGMHLIANGLKWQPGDEIVTIARDYPATVLPWLRVSRDRGGVQIRTVGRHPSGDIDLEHLQATINERTRVVAVTLVDSYTGTVADLDTISELARAHDALLIVNGSQAVGARAVNVADGTVDALVSCGYKWLCGPYATGFTWLSPSLLNALHPQQAYWLAHPAGQDLEHSQNYTIRDDLGVRAFDVFCPANFLVVEPWLAATRLFNEIGPRQIESHDQRLVQQLIDGLDQNTYELLSPVDADDRSTLVVIRPHIQDVATEHERLKAAGVDVAARAGNLRLTPHLYNDTHQIDHVLTVLNSGVDEE